MNNKKIVAMAALISSLFILYNPVYAQIDNIDPLIIETEDGKKFKVDPDFLTIFNDEANIQINLDAKDTKVKLERGEDIEVSFDTPFGDPEGASVTLLDGNVAEINPFTVGMTPRVEFIGDEEVFFDERLPDGAREFEATVPDDIQKGKYKLIVIINYDENAVIWVTKAQVI